ncbi:unnamed protein product [Polarella glacialis]|uniref:Ribosomal RNA large subunit methyltransferase K/L-like methyltransferase domain-containing protein n=1 Tax=Polarella glacialis TaxID=89957 RepID=A0A813KY73_POLGL|nr:unnamed protein product [Polarella glacialis]
MAGKGVVLLEAAVYWPACRYLATEADPEQLAKARENLCYAASRGVLPHGSASMELLRSDCGHLPLPGGCVDVVLCDLPWGRQYGSEVGNADLYPSLLAELARVLRPGTGRAVLVTSATAGNSEAMSAAAASQAELRMVKALGFRFGGNRDKVRCTMYCLVRCHKASSDATAADPEEAERNWEDLFDWSCLVQEAPVVCLGGASGQSGGGASGFFGGALKCFGAALGSLFGVEAEGSNRGSQEWNQELRGGSMDSGGDFIWKDVKPLLQLYAPAKETGGAREMVCGAKLEASGSCSQSKTSKLRAS